jgi:hypothetical protein
MIVRLIFADKRPTLLCVTELVCFNEKTIQLFGDNNSHIFLLTDVSVTISDSVFSFVEKNGTKHEYKLFQRLNSNGSVITVDRVKFNLTKMSGFYVKSIM